MSAFGDWLFLEFGASGTGSHYGVLSGAASDIGEVTLIGSAAAGFVLLYRHLNCHMDHPKNCRRLAFRHLADPDTGEHLRFCRRHHPRKQVTAEHVADVAARIEARGKPGDPTVGA
jgi:hypothetical protein